MGNAETVPAKRVSMIGTVIAVEKYWLSYKQGKGRNRLR